jgi:DNA-binding NarL/FixJ family response regulator
MGVQLSLPLRLPADHYDLVAPYQERELVAFTPKLATQWHVLNREVARDQLSRWVDQPDVYVTPTEFYSWRLIKNAAAFNALFVDLDAHNGEDVMYLVEAALSALQAAGIPEPNCIVYTGRGAHLYWLIERTTARALPRWQACQRRLVKICNGDRMSADATRVLRVVGTTNSKADNFRVRAEPIHPIRRDFDWLADQILERTRTEIRDLRAKRAERQLDTIIPTTQGKPYGSIYERWALVYRDLHAIVAHRWPGMPVEDGHRDTILFHMANALSWFTLSEALENEVQEVARTITPSLTAEQAKSYSSSVLRRALDTTASGRESRYKYARETLYNQLAPLIPDDLLPNLRAIIPNDLAADRKRERNRASDRRRRAAAGMAPRDEYLAQAEEKRRQAHALRRQGLSVREIATQLAISTGSVSGYLKTFDDCSKSACLV